MRVFDDQFADLRDAALDIQDPQMKTPVEDARSERNLITSQAGKTSGGINRPAPRLRWWRRRHRHAHHHFRAARQGSRSEAPAAV